MARVYEDKVEPAVPTRTVRKCVGRVCDLCGAEAKRGNKWDANVYRVEETEVKVTIMQREGSNFPECSMGKEYEVDLCPKCFKDRLVPWLESQGAEIEQREWGW